MSVNYPSRTNNTSPPPPPVAVPIPLRPLNRIRRRSSSLSAIYTSSPELDRDRDLDSNPAFRPTSSRKHTKRSRITSSRNPSSPLKATTCEQRHDAVTVATATASTTLGFSLAPFPDSAFDFTWPVVAPPGTSRTRTSSSPCSTMFRTLGRDPATAAINFVEFPTAACSSRSSSTTTATTASSAGETSGTSSSAPPSPPSVATSPPSVPKFVGSFLVSHSPASVTLATTNDTWTALSMPQSEPEPELSFTLSDDDEEDDDECSCEHRMKCDDDQRGPQVIDIDVEAERLYRVAFEQLRTSTRRDGESFVERMKRWEEQQLERQDGQRHADSVLRLGDDDERGRAGGGPDENEADDEGDAGEVEPDEDDLDLNLDMVVELDRTAPLPPRTGNDRKIVTELELDELTMQMRHGGCEMDDFGLVRRAQARRRRHQQQAQLQECAAFSPAVVVDEMR